MTKGMALSKEKKAKSPPKNPRRQNQVDPQQLELHKTVQTLVWTYLTFTKNVLIFQAPQMPDLFDEILAERSGDKKDTGEASGFTAEDVILMFTGLVNNRTEIDVDSVDSLIDLVSSEIPKPDGGGTTTEDSPGCVNESQYQLGDVQKPTINHKSATSSSLQASTPVPQSASGRGLCSSDQKCSYCSTVWKENTATLSNPKRKSSKKQKPCAQGESQSFQDSQCQQKWVCKLSTVSKKIRKTVVPRQVGRTRKNRLLSKKTFTPFRLAKLLKEGLTPQQIQIDDQNTSRNTPKAMSNFLREQTLIRNFDPQSIDDWRSRPVYYNLCLFRLSYMANDQNEFNLILKQNLEYLEDFRKEQSSIRQRFPGDKMSVEYLNEIDNAVKASKEFRDGKWLKSIETFFGFKKQRKYLSQGIMIFIEEVRRHYVDNKVQDPIPSFKEIYTHHRCPGYLEQVMTIIENLPRIQNFQHFLTFE